MAIYINPDDSGYSRQRKKKAKVTSEINITPLVDVMLVLLIIFMVSAPMLNTGIQVNLPKASANIDINVKDIKPIFVSIKPNGQIYVQDRNAPLDNLISIINNEHKRHIVEYLASNPNNKNNPNLNTLKPRIFINGDKAVAYEKIIQLMDMLQKNDFTNVGLITSPQ